MLLSQLLLLCHWCAWPGPVLLLVLAEAGTGGASRPHVIPAGHGDTHHDDTHHGDTHHGDTHHGDSG